MQTPRHKSPKKAAAAPVGAEAVPPAMGAEFLLSMVEGRYDSKNGNGHHMDSRGQQELQKIEEQIAKLQALAHDEAARQEIQGLHQRIGVLREQVAVHPRAWQKAELARNPQRPLTLEYIERIFTDWSEIHGDRGFADDHALVCGMARFHGEEVAVIGHQKGRDTKQNVYRNWGMTN